VITLNFKQEFSDKFLELVYNSYKDIVIIHKQKRFILIKDVGLDEQKVCLNAIQDIARDCDIEISKIIY
jgi:hypothetical protein